METNNKLSYQLAKSKELKPHYSNECTEVIRFENNLVNLQIQLPISLKDYKLKLYYRIGNDGVTFYEYVAKDFTLVNEEYFLATTQLTRDMCYKSGLFYFQLEWSKGDTIGKSIITQITIHNSLAIEDGKEPDIFIYYEDRLNKILDEAKEEFNEKVTDVVDVAQPELIPTTKAMKDYLDTLVFERGQAVEYHFSISTFPLTGEVGILYYENEKEGIYIWDKEELIYKQLNSPITEIYGGNAYDE